MRTRIWLVFALSSFLIVSGCMRDPETRKRKFMESGQNFYSQHKYRDAAIQFSNALQIDRHFAEGHYQLARAYMGMKVWGGAYGELAKTIEIDSKHYPAHVQFGTLLLVARDYASAKEQAKLVLQAEPKNLDARRLLANVLAGEGNTQDALIQLNDIARSVPNDPESYINLAVVLEQDRQSAAAEENLKKAISVAPKEARPHTVYAEFLIHKQRVPEAEQELRTAAGLNLDQPGSRIDLAKFLLAQNHPDEAEDVLHKLKASLPDNPEAFRSVGEFYMWRNDLPKATAEFEALYKEHPEDTETVKTYIDLLLLSSRKEEARKVNEEILKKTPEDVDAQIVKASLLYQDNKFNDALQLLEAALKADPDNARAHYMLGVTFNAMGNLERAQSEWVQSARLNPDFVDTHNVLAAVGVTKGDYKLLLEHAEHLVRLQPYSPAGYILRATAEATLNRQKDAEVDLQRAIAVAPDNSTAYTKYGVLRILQKKYPEAAKYFETALTKNPNDTEAMQGLVMLFMHDKATDKAVARLQQQITLAPDNSRYQVMLGDLIKPKDVEGARAAYMKAVQSDKNYSQGFQRLAQLEFDQGQLPRAIEIARQWSTAHPRDVLGYVILGSLMEAKGDWSSARDQYEAALRIDPDAALAANNLAFILLQHDGNLDVALTLAQTARRNLPDSPDIADTLAWAYYKKNRYGLSIDLLNEAIKRQPNDASMEMHLGLAYRELRDKKNATEHLNKALALGPNGPTAPQVRAALDSLATIK